MLDKDNNRGTLFRNKKKERDNQPDYDGTANIDGKPYWINGWVHSFNNDQGEPEKYFRFSFRPKDAPVSASKMAEVGTDDVPF